MADTSLELDGALEAAAEMAYNGLCLAAENGLDVPWTVLGVSAPARCDVDEVQIVVSLTDGRTVEMTARVHR